jgi:hypothetical protein
MTGMRCLPPYEQSIVCRAQQFGLAAASPTPACLHQDLGPVVSLILAVMSFGYSLIIGPIYAANWR